MIFSIDDMAMYPDKAEEIAPKIKGKISKLIPLEIALNPDKKSAPSMTGILIKKAKVAVLFFSSPLNAPKLITVPLLESPGKIASACPTPIAMEILDDSG